MLRPDYWESPDTYMERLDAWNTQQENNKRIVATYDTWQLCLPHPDLSWLHIATAPTDSQWIDVIDPADESVHRVHYACDLSGSEQPPFRGYFKDRGSYFAEIGFEPSFWRPSQGLNGSVITN